MLQMVSCSLMHLSTYAVPILQVTAPHSDFLNSIKPNNKQIIIKNSIKTVMQCDNILFVMPGYILIVIVWAKTSLVHTSDFTRLMAHKIFLVQ